MNDITDLPPRGNLNIRVRCTGVGREHAAVKEASYRKATALAKKAFSSAGRSLKMARSGLAPQRCLHAQLNWRSPLMPGVGHLYLNLEEEKQMFTQINAFRVFTLITLFACCANAHSQTPDVTAFHQRFIELRKKVKAEGDRVKKLNLKDSTATNQATEELHNLISQVEQLQNTSVETYRNKPDNEAAKYKPVRFVAQGCLALKFAIDALGNYVVSGDATFLDLYREWKSSGKY